MLTTRRLFLRPFRRYDLAFLDRLHSDPAVTRFLGTGDVRSRADNRRWLENTLAAYDTGVGQFLVCKADTGEPIGRCGVSRYQIEHAGRLSEVFFGGPPRPGCDSGLELGYTLLQRAWRQGYATEAAEAVRDHAYTEFDAPRLISLIATGNDASMRVSTKLGFYPQQNAVYRGVLCVITARQRQTDRLATAC